MFQVKIKKTERIHKLAYGMLLLLICCKGQVREKTAADGLIKIDIFAEYPQKDLVLQEIAGVEYIPLETRPGVLLDQNALNRICMSDSLIITPNTDGTVYIFNRQGKFIHAFNHTGRSGEEYHSIQIMAADFPQQEIYIYDSRKIQVYDWKGTFKRTLKLPANFNYLYQLFNYNEDTLLGCFSSGWDIPGRLNETNDKQPYWMISKKDGHFTPLSLNLSERVLNLAFIHNPQEAYFVPGGMNTIAKNGNDFIIADFGSDTIYRLENNHFIPYLLKNPSHTWEKQIPVMGCVELATRQYTFLCFSDISLNSQFCRKLVYDHKTKEIFRYSPINNDYLPPQKMHIDWRGQIFLQYPQCYESDLPPGYARIKLLSSQLKADYEAGKLTGQLKEVAATLHEDDNPVLMLVKFKD